MQRTGKTYTINAKKARWSHLDNTLTDSLKENNTKLLFFGSTSHLRQINVGVAPIKHKGQLHSDSETKAKLLNHQFQSVFYPGNLEGETA